MNDDDYWVEILKNYVYKNAPRDWSWTVNQAYKSGLNSREIYEVLNQLEDYNRKETDMAYTYSRGNWYQDTRGDEVATATLEAYANGVDFETLIQKNKTVRQYWYQIQNEKAARETQRIRDQERLRKLAEKRAEEKAKREEVMTKLTPEELEAFGLIKKGKKK